MWAPQRPFRGRFQPNPQGGSNGGNRPPPSIFLSKISYLWKEMAETEGFEPSVPDLPVRRFSKPLVSATHPRLRIAAAETAYSGGFRVRQG